MCQHRSCPWSQVINARRSYQHARKISDRLMMLLLNGMRIHLQRQTILGKDLIRSCGTFSTSFSNAGQRWSLKTTRQMHSMHSRAWKQWSWMKVFIFWHCSHSTWSWVSYLQKETPPNYEFFSRTIMKNMMPLWRKKRKNLLKNSMATRRQAWKFIDQLLTHISKM